MNANGKPPGPKFAPMRFLLWPFRLLYVLYACTLFVALMLLVFIWALVSLPFGPIKSGNMVYAGCKAWADAWFALVFIRHRNSFRGSPQPNRSYIFVANHISYLDSAIIPKTFRMPVRPLGKVEMARIPIFGFIYRNAIVTVDRSSAENRARSVKALKEVLQQGISVLVFPEGTFNTTGRPLKEFYDGAFRIAIETGTPIMPVLLLDSYTRMHYASFLTLNPGRSRALFLPEVPVAGLTLADLPQLKARVHRLMEQELVAAGAAWIGEGEKTVYKA
jgi:1-acyl-sn-glycerol-3-phosphate acyltransferase